MRLALVFVALTAVVFAIIRIFDPEPRIVGVFEGSDAGSAVRLQTSRDGTFRMVWPAKVGESPGSDTVAEGTYRISRGRLGLRGRLTEGAGDEPISVRFDLEIGEGENELVGGQLRLRRVGGGPRP
ncbi:MAG: hypothetical protein SNJ61_01515 [Fimbriimonadaceae bacterium]